MASALTWLDASSEEQRQVREIVQVFADRDSRDELGIGQVRDVFSERLFPGTSVIQTRARYFLFVPWLFMDAERRRRSGAELAAYAHNGERKLIEALRKEGDLVGLIGREAGIGLKTLPSTIYWSGLQRYGILQSSSPADCLGVIRQRSHETDEVTERATSTWHPSIPEAPTDFPWTVDGAFALTHEEATWLRERIVQSDPDSLLAYLLTGGNRPSSESVGPWNDDTCRSASPLLQDLITHAQCFSVSMLGAQLLYNLLVAEKYEAEGNTRLTGLVEYYRERIEAWEAEVALLHLTLSQWDREAFWALVFDTNPRIRPPTLAFINTWLDYAGRSPRRTNEGATPRQLVASREIFQKKRKQSRLVNTRLLSTWNGASGTRQLVFRWGQVRNMVDDVLDGLQS